MIGNIKNLKTVFFGTLSLLIFVSGLPAQTKECNRDHVPIVFLHGFLASGDTYAKQVIRFREQGYCADHLQVFDWNTLGGNLKLTVGKLDTFIDQILIKTKSASVHLVGHSAGGGLGYAYLADSLRAMKVSKYVHLGSSGQTKPAGANGAVSTLNIFSEGDFVVKGKEIPGAKNLILKEQDHYQIATCKETFDAMFAFFSPTAVQMNPVRRKQTFISGKILTLGENVPQKGARLEVYRLDPGTGYRKGKAIAIFISDATGHWGPLTIRKEERYEFYVTTGKEGDRPVQYFREPFEETNHLVYLRTFPGKGSVAGLLLAALPNKEDQRILAIFSSSKAIIHGRDSLRVGEHELSSAEISPISKTIITMFLYDNGDKETSLVPHKTFQAMRSFLTGVDYFIPSSKGRYLPVYFNQRRLSIPQWSADNAAISVAVFE
jgi:pimeloyl-ACP methyl ester carboxylesterase